LYQLAELTGLFAVTWTDVYYYDDSYLNMDNHKFVCNR